MNKTAETKPYQLIMPYVIYSADNINPTAKLILTEIFNMFKAGNKHCWASNGHFAEMFSLEKSNVSKCIQQLQKTGWIMSKPYKHCNLDYCTLKESGWHRHIIAGDTLSKIFDSLSTRVESLSKKRGYPIESPKVIRVNNEINNENKENLKKVEDMKKEIREKIKSFH